MLTLTGRGPVYTHTVTGYGGTLRVARSYGRLFGLAPYDFRFPSNGRARLTFWDTRDGRFLVPAFFGAGLMLNLRGAYRHPVQVALVAAFVLRRIRARRGR